MLGHKINGQASVSEALTSLKNLIRMGKAVILEPWIQHDAPSHPRNCDLKSKWHYRQEEIGLWYSHRLFSQTTTIVGKRFSYYIFIFSNSILRCANNDIWFDAVFFCCCFFFYCKINVEWHFKCCQIRTTWNLEDFRCSTRSSYWINEIYEDRYWMQTIAFWG